MKFTIACLFAVGLIFNAVGCDTKSETGKKVAAKPDEHDHDHEGEGVHVVHGPKGGHVFDFAGDSGKKLEFTYSKNNNVIKIFVMDKDSKETPVAAPSMSVRYKMGATPVTFELAAVEAVDGKTSQFMLDSEELSVAIFQGVDVVVKDGDQELVASIPAHERHEH